MNLLRGEQGRSADAFHARAIRRCRLIALLSLLAALEAPGQSTPGVMPAVSVGSAEENYLRYLASVDTMRFTSWTIRPLSFAQLSPIVLVDPATFIDRGPVEWRRGNASLSLMPASGVAWYNTSYPFGGNDGAVWRGRGLTVATTAGARLQWGPLRATLAPEAFIAENRGFPLMQPDTAAANPFSNPTSSWRIDRPQRFGNDAYGRLDPGQSSIRLEQFGLTAGISTESQWMGPMSEWPFVLGDNAPGFPNLFAGSSSPWNIGIGRIHGRVFYGRLSQSDYSNAADTASRRFTTGIGGVFMPAFAEGLEIGFVRMFEVIWPRDGIGWRELRKPFEAFLKEHVTGDPNARFNDSADNQMASLFARWVFSQSGVEVYGEYGRDDHNWNGRDAILEPDHASSYGLGMRKAWKGNRDLNGVTAELVSFDPSTLSRSGRAQSPVYAHYRVRQGHTERGQNLGTTFAVANGTGAMIGFDRYSSAHEARSLSVTRMVIREESATPAVDIQYAVAADYTHRIGGMISSIGVTSVIELNRYFSADVGNVMLTYGVRW